MENFEVFCWNFSSSINLFFLKSDYSTIFPIKNNVFWTYVGKSTTKYVCSRIILKKIRLVFSNRCPFVSTQYIIPLFRFLSKESERKRSRELENFLILIFFNSDLKHVPDCNICILFMLLY